MHAGEMVSTAAAAMLSGWVAERVIDTARRVTHQLDACVPELHTHVPTVGAVGQRLLKGLVIDSPHEPTIEHELPSPG